VTGRPASILFSPSEVVMRSRTGLTRRAMLRGSPGLLLASGNLVARWGAPLSPEGETAPAVLAYLKTDPEQGGPVLLQDGRTIKTMTADEFNAASKDVGR
jgi:hypothetical protein